MPEFSKFVASLEKYLLQTRQIRFNGYTKGLLKSFDLRKHKKEADVFFLGQKKILTKLRTARKFVLSPDFYDFTIKAANADKQVALRLSLVAKPPFDPCWIQFIATDEIEYGFLIESDQTTEEQYVIYPAAHFIGSTSADFYPIKIVTCKEGDSAVPIGNAMFPYYSHSGIFFFDFLGELGRRTGDFESVHKLNDWMERCHIETRRFYRAIPPLLGMMATHLPDDLIKTTTSVKSQKRFLKSKFLPSYEYKILDILRPMDLKTFTNRIVKAPLYGIDRRWHEVMGAWHHRRISNEVCHFPANLCPLATWIPNFDSEGKEIGSNQHKCTLCSRIRWWQPNHARGSKDVGIVEKDYTVKTRKEAD